MSTASTPGDGEEQRGQGHVTAEDVLHSREARRMQRYPVQSLLSQPAQYFNELMETEVDDGTIGLLKNLFSRDLPLANFTEADVHEARWIARNIIEFVYAEHPDPRSTFTGARRKMLSGDYSNGLRPLSGIQRAWIEMAVFDFIGRISRGKGGFQQEQFSKQYTVSELVRDGLGGDRSRGLGRLIPGRR